MVYTSGERTNAQPGIHVDCDVFCGGMRLDNGEGPMQARNGFDRSRFSFSHPLMGDFIQALRLHGRSLTEKKQNNSCEATGDNVFL